MSLTNEQIYAIASKVTRERLGQKTMDKPTYFIIKREKCVTCEGTGRLVQHVCFTCKAYVLTKKCRIYLASNVMV